MTSSRYSEAGFAVGLSCPPLRLANDVPVLLAVGTRRRTAIPPRPPGWLPHFRPTLHPSKEATVPLMQGGPPEWIWERTPEALRWEVVTSDRPDGQTVYE